MIKYRLAIVTSHPIQYQTPLFKRLAQNKGVDPTVYFCWNFGVEKAGYDKEFGQNFKWDIPLLEGYRSVFLRNISPRPSTKFLGQINFGILKELTRERHDGVLIFGWNSLTNWLAVGKALFVGMPIFLRGENPLYQEFLKSSIKVRIKKAILGWLFRRINFFFCIGEENKKFYEYYGVPAPKLLFVPYAVDNERYIRERKHIDREAARRGLSFDSTKSVLLFVGKFIDKKNPLDLLRAYDKIVAKNKALIFVGDGPLREALESYVKEHHLRDVHFIGFKNQTELAKYYAAADIFVLPSGLGETWGLVVNEAMCFGLPVIVSDVVGCNKDLVKPGHNGYVFPLGNVDALAAHLQDLILHEEKRRAFGQNSFEIIQAYSYEVDIGNMLHVLKR